MKKFATILVIIVSVLALTGCSIIKNIPEIIRASQYESMFDAPEKVFSHNGLNITLNAAFAVTQETYEDVVIGSYSEEFIVVVIWREDVSDTVYEDDTLGEFAEALRERTDASTDGIKSVDEIIYYEYCMVEDGENCKCCTIVTEGEKNDFYVVAFVCLEEEYDEFFTYFIDWAKTITFE